MLDLLENHTASKAVLDSLDPNTSIGSKLSQSSTPVSLTSRNKLLKKEDSTVGKPFIINNMNTTNNSSSISTGLY